MKSPARSIGFGTVVVAGLWLPMEVERTEDASRSEPPALKVAVVGTVRSPEDRAVAGAVVTVRTDGAAFQVSVVTDTAGRFLTSVHSGSHRIRASAIGFGDSAARTISVEDGSAEPVEMDLELKPRTDGWDGAPSSAFLGLLPDGETKRRFILDCSGCHPFDRLILEGGEPASEAEDEAGNASGSPARSRLKTLSEWVENTDLMLSFAGAHTSFPIMSASREALETGAWLVESLGDGTLERAPLVLPINASAEAARAVITEYDVPVSEDLPHDLMVAPDGGVVITGMMTQQMYVLDPGAGDFRHVPIAVGGGARALDIDENGDWYMLLGGPPSVARFDPAGEEWSRWEVGMYPHSTQIDASGRIWFNGHFTKEPELIGFVDPAAGEVRTFEVPADAMPDGGSTIPYGLRIGPDGTVWATQLVGNRLIRFDPATVEFRLYEMPTPYSGPRRLDVAPDGTVWIPQFAASKLARFDPATETFKEYDFPVPDGLPYVVRVDPKRGRVWVGTAAADVLASFDPETERFTLYPLPTRGALTRHIDVDATTGDVWAAYGPWPPRGAKVARLQIR